MIIDHTAYIVDDDLQGIHNSCVWMTIATFWEMVWCKLTGERRRFSAAFGWQGQKGDNDNEGVIPSVAFYFLKKHGICLEQTYPYTEENLHRQPPPEAYEEAKRYRIGASVILTDVDAVLPYLARFPLFGSFRFRGVNHAMLIVGYRDDDGATRWHILNWWDGLTLFWMDDTEFRQSFKQAIAVKKMHPLVAIARAFNAAMKAVRGWFGR